MSRLLEETRTLARRAAETYRGAAEGAWLAGLAASLDEPLRVAIAGRVKAGKSTLLNALVGDRLAPTDAGECTRIVTWYADGHTYEVLARPVGGEPRQLRFERDEAAIRIDLGDLAPEQVSSLHVTWPSAGLRAATLIDTPGIGSLSAATSQRTWDVLTDSEDEGSVADVVIYLVRHLHADDAEFLTAFHDTSVGRPSPINTVAVLSRADEVGAGRLDALTSARQVAARLAARPEVRGLVQGVVPVAGLLAETAATLTEDEFGWLRRIAALDKATADGLLLTVDRFAGEAPGCDLAVGERARLLERFGLFGVRISTTMIRHGVVEDATTLATELSRRSGIQELRTTLDSLFLQRRDVLKCRSVLQALDGVVMASPMPGSEEIVAEVERITASAHAFRELRVLAGIRAGWVSGKPEALAEAERLVGGAGTRLDQRLGADPGTDPSALRGRAAADLERWQRRAENPMTSHQLAAAARVVIQSCEGMLAELHAGGAR